MTERYNGSHERVPDPQPPLPPLPLGASRGGPRDDSVWYAGAWRTPEGVERARLRYRQRQRRRRAEGTGR